MTLVQLELVEGVEAVFAARCVEGVLRPARLPKRSDKQVKFYFTVSLTQYQPCDDRLPYQRRRIAP